MRLNNSIYLLVIIVYSCRGAYCPENANNIEKFRKSFEFIESAKVSNTDYYLDDYRDALYFLSNTSGIPSHADISSTYFYRNKLFYNEDMKAWKNWLKHNSCKLTNSYVDSAMKMLVDSGSNKIFIR